MLTQGRAPTSLTPLIALGLCAFAVFITELALMRAVAQVTWPPFAFLALSAAMLGGGVAGTLLAVKPAWAESPAAPATGALLVAFGSPAAVWAALSAGLEPLRLGSDPGEAVLFLGVLLLLGVPFVGLGVALSALLEQTEGRPQLPYGADLCGGALGAFLAVPLIDGLGIAAVGGLSALLAAGAATLLEPTGARVSRRGVAALAALLGLLVAWIDGDFLPYPTTDKKVGQMPTREVLRKLKENDRLVTADRADGRVDVIPARPAPRLLIDLGAAVTRAPVYPFRDGPPRDAASAAFMATAGTDGEPKEDAADEVLVIGAGAGFEVARALAWGADRVDAVEVSSGIVDLVQDGSVAPSKRVFSDPRVRLHLDEARSFLERSERRWTHIVAVHTITNAALSVGAMRLAEDFLLTRESLATMVAHLEPEGVLYLTRPAGQLDLLVDVARAGLLAAGVEDDEVDEHLVVVEPDRPDPFFRGLLVFRSPAPPDLWTPTGTHAAPPPPRRHDTLPTDDRPFFHRRADEVEQPEARLQIEGPALAENALTWVGVLSSLAALAVLLFPLLARRRRADLPPPPLSLLGVAGLLGVGFMFAELALAQRLTLLLGRPLVAFAVVVGGMLLGAGSGALLSSGRRIGLVSALGLAAATTSLAVVVPGALDTIGALGWPATARLLTGATLAAVIALPLGLPFPALIEAARARGAEASAPWLYAINAVTAVGAGALHASLAPQVGLSGTTLIAGALYGLALLLAR